jgi:hypothetical protein
MDEQDKGLGGPMNSLRPTASPAALPVLPIALSLFLTVFLIVAPFASCAASAQTLREAGKAAAQAQAQSKSCVAKADEWLKECEEEEADEKDDGVPDRTGLGWTGIALASAGAVQTGIGLNVSRWRNCGPANVHHCKNLERVYRISGGTLLATGLTFLVLDETRRYRNRSPARQTVIDIGPRAIQVRMLF